MVTATCVVCGETREVGPFEQVEPDTAACSDDCAEFFEQLVYRLHIGSNCWAEGIDPNSKLGQTAIKVVQRQRILGKMASYEEKQREVDWDDRQEALRRKAKSATWKAYRGW
jgi:hypothetical protein